MSIWRKIVLCSYQILFKRPLTFNQIFSQILDERSLELKMQYIVCITFANTVNTVNQKQKGCLRIIRVAIDRYETFTNECNLYIFHFFFFVIIVYSGAQDVCALMMKHGLTPDGKMWVYFNPFPPKSEEKVISLLITIHILVSIPCQCQHKIFTAKIHLCLRVISANKMRNFTILHNSNDENCKMNSGKPIMTHVYIKFSQLKFTYALVLCQPSKWGTLLFWAIVMMKIAKWIQGSQVWPMSISNSHCYNLL